MSLFYYRIKVYDGDNYYSNWTVLKKGLIEADSSKEAKKQVEETNQHFQTKKKRDEDHKFGDIKILLQECNEYWKEYWTAPRICKTCQLAYTVITQEEMGFSANRDSCSPECSNHNRLVRAEQSYENYLITNKHPAVIYKITHKATNQVYIGQTLQAFTLRWYQHFFQTGDTKFHKLIKSSNVTEWIFEIVEVIDDKKDRNFVNSREKFWIDHYDSIANGLNSADLKDSAKLDDDVEAAA